jgi:3-oxoacyl-[acyl-carrier-protein] synthase-1
MSGYLQNDRLLIAENSNGFMPGEGAAALLIGGATGQTQLTCLGLGFATEAASIEKELPLRGEGLTAAIKGALSDAGLTMQEVDFRIADLSGEQYYFKEAALALTRTLRARKERFDLWHPAECIGETGAVGGLATIVVAHAACHKGYAIGPTILCHSAGDSGERAAAILQLRAPS